MCQIGTVVSDFRGSLHLGLREVCRLAEKSPLIPEAISPAYLSRVEHQAGHIDPEQISLDKLWALGVVLEVDPLLLFVVSRPQLDPRLYRRAYRERLFDVCDVPDIGMGVFLKNRRYELGLTMHEVESYSHRTPHACFGISSGFLSQIETDFRGVGERVSGEKLWALGVVLRVDPLALYALSRKLGQGMYLRLHRLSLFRHFSL
jgi:transcriptional regulator with XRE-family HTH domain